MQLTKLLKLQLVYLFLAIGWNVVAIAYTFTGNTEASPAQYLPNLPGLAVYFLFIALGHFGYIKPYRILMALYGVGAAYIGIYPWIVLLLNLETTFQLIPIISGISVNGYGVILCVIAALGRFTFEKK